MEKKSKLASAIAGAIMAYIIMEEEARGKALAKTSRGAVSLWSVSARQDAMQLRRFYQLRFFKR